MLVLTAMNDSHTEVDSSKTQSLVDGTSSRKRCQVDNVEELVLANQNGATPLGDTTRTGLSL